MICSDQPGKLTAPIVSHQVEMRSVKRVHQRKRIADKRIGSVVLDAFRASASRVAALIGRNCAIASETERFQLMAPYPAGLRKTVKEQNRRAGCWPGQVDCEGESACCDNIGLDHWP